MGNKAAILFLIAAIAFYRVGLSQTAYGDRNYRYVDSVEQTIKHYLCNDLLTYPSKYKKRKVKNDMQIVGVLNNIFHREFSVQGLNSELNKIHELKVSRNETMNGLIRVIGIVVSGSYVRAELKLECIDDFIIRKECLLFSTSNGHCGELGYRILDFNLFTKHFVKDLNFLIKVSDNAYVSSPFFSASVN